MVDLTAVTNFVKAHYHWIIIAVLVIVILGMSIGVSFLRGSRERMGGDATMNTIYTSGASMRHLGDRTDTGGQTETMTGSREDPYVSSVAYRTYVDKDNMDASLNGTIDRRLEELSVNRMSHHIENFADGDPLGETREEALQAALY